jgi:hypothetical protein
VGVLKIFITFRTDPAAIDDESGEHATEFTPASSPKVFTHPIPLMSHTLTVPSEDPDMTSFLLPDQQTLST